jgi:hypothetical protein
MELDGTSIPSCGKGTKKKSLMDNHEGLDKYKVK